MNENGRREKSDRRQSSEPVATERRKKTRRRQIDPTTCERDYTDDEIEFMHALDAYKRANGRMFPTCSEILEVVRSIGYEKIDRMEIVEEIVEVEAEAGQEAPATVTPTPVVGPAADLDSAETLGVDTLGNETLSEY